MRNFEYFISIKKSISCWKGGNLGVREDIWWSKIFKEVGLGVIKSKDGSIGLVKKD